MRSVVEHMLHRDLAAAVTVWHLSVRRMGKMRRVASCMLHMHAVQEWRLKVQAHRAKQRAETLLRRTAGRMLGREVALAYGEWARNCRADQQTVLQNRCKRLQQEKQQLSLKMSSSQAVQ